MNERRSDIEPLRAILHRALVRYLPVQPEGFLPEPRGAPRPTLDVRILSFGGARTLYRKRRPECRSLDGVHSVSQAGRRCASCEERGECTPQVRLDLLVDARAFRLLLAHTSARNFLAYEGDLRVKGVALDEALHHLEVVGRGTWGEVRFSCKDA